MSLWIILAVLQRWETCIFKTKVKIDTSKHTENKMWEGTSHSYWTPPRLDLSCLRHSAVSGSPLSGRPLTAWWHIGFHTLAMPGTRQWTDRWPDGQSSTINLELFGIANLIPFNVHKFSIWEMFTFTPKEPNQT